MCQLIADRRSNILALPLLSICLSDDNPSRRRASDVDALFRESAVLSLPFYFFFFFLSHRVYEDGFNVNKDEKGERVVRKRIVRSFDKSTSKLVVPFPLAGIGTLGLVPSALR